MLMLIVIGFLIILINFILSILIFYTSLSELIKSKCRTRKNVQ